MIAYAKRDNLLDLYYIITGNLLGCGLIGFLASFYYTIDITNVISKKLSQSELETFVLAILCGVLMYVAVQGYKNTTMTISLILPVAIFIICGFEHCIANSFYFMYNGFNSAYIPHLCISIIGNSVGSISAHHICKGVKNGL